METLVLLSGGIDSAACARFYIDLGHRVEAFFVDYGQDAREREKQSAGAIAKHYQIPIRQITLSGARPFCAGEISGRNAFLVMCALVFGSLEKGMIGLGIHAGTPYYDCQEQFVADLTPVIDGYSAGRIALGTPFLSWTKDLTWDYCRQHNVPISLTWSCEVGSAEPCKKCRSCRDIEALHARETN